VRERIAMALPFDVGTLRAAGPPVPVAQDVGGAGQIGFEALSVSQNGVLLYGRGFLNSSNRRLAWFDRSGKDVGTQSDTKRFRSMALSPNGKQAAVTIATSADVLDVWLEDLERARSTRFTFGLPNSNGVVWSPDGSYLVFADGRMLKVSLFRKPVNSAAGEELLVQAGQNASPLDISADGKLLVYSQTEGNTRNDLWLLPLQGDSKPVKYLDSPFDESQAQFSPDGSGWRTRLMNRGKSRCTRRRFRRPAASTRSRPREGRRRAGVETARSSTTYLRTLT
jgi:dipeptidyl aminopeptidase/acylaminoacyl peptidase